MRKSQLAISIQLAMIPGNPVPIRPGPVSPYQTEYNRKLYYQQFAKNSIISARSEGKTSTLTLENWMCMKTLLWPYHYQGLSHAR